MEYRLVTPKNIIHISVAEAASDFASLLVRVRVESVEFVIEERGRSVAVLSPVEPITQEKSE
jgi:antitoxin (DNA-binding transcriptional repressor) of toxin-antitoxin stability system